MIFELKFEKSFFIYFGVGVYLKLSKNRWLKRGKFVGTLDSLNFYDILIFMVMLIIYLY